jgi:hypothetical protein
MSARSATRADRFDDCTAENVASARTSVPPAVAIEEIVTQSATRSSLPPPQVWPAAGRGIIGAMPRVRLTAAGRGVGASDEDTGFSEMVRVEIAKVAPAARPDIRIGQDDAVSVSVELDRDDQAGVGDLLERLLQDARVESSVLEDPESVED